ncbi:hypothetical protein [Haloferax sp. ATB1]|uniref:hypothetical protein n=1 Tax=Haloferax sp. ATB1 TaxID=1508454 RepID=UPI000693D462|nr:hypothetical protein [Haloferax sp. ATB1]
MLESNPPRVASLLALVATVALLAWAARRGALSDPRVERVLGRTWPDLWYVRRDLLPRLERRLPFIKFELPLHDAEIAGVIDDPPSVVRDRLRSREKIFPNNCAALKRWHGRRECGSYAHRPSGLFGRWQTHIRLFPGPDGGTVVAAHGERSPLAGLDESWLAALRGAWRHYTGDGWSARDGVMKARRLLDMEGP